MNTEKEAKNNKYEIEIGSPLIRAGITIRTTVSEKYVESAVEKMMEMVRKLNNK